MKRSLRVVYPGVSSLLLATALLPFFILSFAHADVLDDAILELMRKRKVPGLSLAIVQDGKIVRAQGYGVIEAGGTAPVTPDTLFQAGSVSKPVAAFAALQLVDAKRLSLDEDVNRQLTSWQVAENEFTANEKVTVRRLLNHTAGLTVHGFPGYAVGTVQPTLLQVLDGTPPANTPAIRADLVPGTKWRYSGGGYTVLQQLAIDVTGQSYPDFTHTTALAPLGMDASTFAQPLPDALAGRTATGHIGAARPVPGRWHVYPEMAAAGLWTTPSDLARFAIAVQDALAGKPGALLKPETARLMVTRGEGNFGLGFALAGDGTTERFTHGGRDQGFDAQFVAYRKTGLAAVVMINANNNTSFMTRVMQAIARHYEWPEYPHYTPPQPIEDKEPEVTAQLKALVEQIHRGEVDRELFTAEMAAHIDAFLTRQDDLQETQAYGALKSIALIGRRDEGTYRHYRYLVGFEHETTILICTFNEEGRIAILRMGVE